ncbi:MAG: TolB family protein, partial [Planctomycetota bacterium]
MKNLSNRFFLKNLFTLILMSAAIISCDTVVFIADNDADGNNELYVSRINGIMVLELSTGGDVQDFKISPDGSRVAYRADQDTDGVIELYVNSITGGMPVKVSGLLIGGGNVELLQLPPPLPPFEFDVFIWSPDSSWIAYIADQTSDTVYELYVSTPDGSSNFRVSANLVENGDVIDFEWSPDSSSIAYRADGDTVGVYELYTTTPEATPILNKVSDLPPGVVPNDVVVPRPGFPNDEAGTLYLDAFEWAPDSSAIAYAADQIDNNTFELFAVPPDGSDPPTEVSAISGSPFDVLEFKWAPDSSWLAYRADQNTEEVYELFTARLISVVPTVFDTPIKVHPNLTGNKDVKEFKWSPDSSRIAYRAEQDTDNVVELYTSPPDSSTGNTKINPNTFVPGQNVTAFAWAPDSSRLAYRADQDANDVFELYTSLPDGS